MAGQAQVVITFALKYGPTIGKALADLVAFVKANPSLPAAVRSRLADITRRLNAVSKRTGAAKITGMLDIIRDVAGEASADGQSAVDAGPWITRADSIGRRVRLASALPRADQKKALALLMTETKVALADLIEALAPVGPARPAVAPAEEL